MNNSWISDEEKEMIQQCIKGDVHHQKKLYTFYIEAMFNKAVRILGDKALAKDAVQNAFMDVFKDLIKFRGESTLGAWIKRIVVNHSLQVLKKRSKLMEDELVSEAIYLDSNENFEDNKIDLRLIKEGISALPDGCRIVFSLYLMEGYKHEEIAQIMGVSQSTSKSQYRRAKQLLKQWLKERI